MINPTVYFGMQSKMAKLNVLRMALMPLLVLLISLPVVLLLLVLDSEPSLAPLPALSPSELNELEDILLENAPEATSRASQKSITLDAEELHLLLRYSAQLYEPSRPWTAQIALSDEQLHVDANIGLVDFPSRFFLKMESTLGPEQGRFKIQQLTLGKLSVPARLIGPFLNLVIENLVAANPARTGLEELAKQVSNLQISPAALSFDIQWQPELIAGLSNQIQQLFVSDEDRRRIAHYHTLISNTIAAIPSDIRAVPLHTLLISLFTAVREESDVSGNPAAENRAAFQALSVYLNRKDIASTTGFKSVQGMANPRPVEVRLQQREDLAQHVASVAAISSSAGAGLAQLLSTTKEAYDARYRTGFSFSDLTANSVGVALAEFATRNDASALEFQRRVITLSDDSEYMPAVGNNRDGITEEAFSDRYRDRSSVEFAQRLREIQTMIAERPFFANQQKVDD